jgi:hypothetical protein
MKTPSSHAFTPLSKLTWALPALTILMVGCSAAEGRSETTDAGTSDASAGVDRDGGTDAPAPATPKAACEALIACIADIAPTSVGGLVSLYGDASNCWKGGAADADACGKACKKSLEERPECTAVALDRSYAAVCDLEVGNLLRFDAKVAYDPRKGGKLVFHPVASDATTYTSGMGLVEAPAIPLVVDSQGGKGTSDVPFEYPARALGDLAGFGTVVLSQTVEKLRLEETVLCSELRLIFTSGPRTEQELRGSCMYFPLANGTAFPRPTESDIRSCVAPRTSKP